MAGRPCVQQYHCTITGYIIDFAWIQCKELDFNKLCDSYVRYMDAVIHFLESLMTGTIYPQIVNSESFKSVLDICLRNIFEKFSIGYISSAFTLKSARSIRSSIVNTCS